MSDQFDIAVVGATGAVGESMLEIELKVENLADFDFSKVAIGLFSAGGSVSAEFAPEAAAAGCVVVDNTSHFRRDDEIPLVVPEVNADAIAAYKTRGIIANPNCSTIQMLVALKPIYDAVGIERINVCTYQAVSGAGRSAIEELVRQTATLLNGRPLEIEGGAKQIAFNAIPHIDVFQDNRYTREEMKMVWETRKILDDNTILVNPTAVRIPAFYGHSEAVHIETRDKISAQAVAELLAKSPGIEVVDGVDIGQYPTAVTEASGTDPVFVGRIREDISHPRGIDLWVVADNIRKGAALNSVQIAEILAKNYL
jgi:aspartate-semialdehyde dehydrogenase